MFNINNYQMSIDLAEKIRETMEVPNPVSLDKIIKLVNQINGKINFKLSFKIDKIIKKTDNGFILTVSAFQRNDIQLMNIAFGLGYLFCNMGYLIDEKTWNNTSYDDLTKINDYEKRNIYYKKANVFANELIMPKYDYLTKINELKDINNKVDLNILANYFNVTVPSVKYRGECLKVL